MNAMVERGEQGEGGFDDFFDNPEADLVVTEILEDPLEQELIAELDKHVIGQDEAKKTLVSAVVGSINSIMPQEGPLGVYVLYGASSLGKTLLPTKLGEILTGQKGATTRTAGGNHTDRFEVSKLFQAAPGLVGATNSTPLTDDNLFKAYNKGKDAGTLHPILEKTGRPFAVWLVDELEKFHPIFYNRLLDAMDDGKVSFQVGKEQQRNLPYSQVTDLGGTIIVMTSNIGASEAKKNGMGFTAENDGEKVSKFKDALKSHFEHMPEFLNRVHEDIVFEKLGKEGCRRILYEVQSVQYIEAIRDLWGGFVDVEIEDDILEKILDDYYSDAKQGRAMKDGFREALIRPTDKVLSANSSFLEEVIERESPVLLRISLDENKTLKYTFVHSNNMNLIAEYQGESRGEVTEILDNGNALRILEECRKLHTAYVVLKEFEEKLGVSFETEKGFISKRLKKHGYSENDIKRLDLGCAWETISEFDFVLNGNFGDFKKLKEEIPFMKTSVVDIIVSRVLDSEYNLDTPKDFIIKAGVSIQEFIEGIFRGVLGRDLESEELVILFKSISKHLLKKKIYV